MQFRTEFSIPASSWKINLNSRVISLGSCFAEVLGKRLQYLKLSSTLNPFGTLFSPTAMFKLIRMALTDQPADDRLFLQVDDYWLHYDYHSSISANNKAVLKEHIQELHKELKEKLRNVDVLVLTFGTAWNYRLPEPVTYVANCHKQPARLFERNLLSVKEICEEFGQIYHLLHDINPGLHIILTVSPVRHAKDGMTDNAVSKSILRAACHYLTVDSPVSYFPAYELLLDDLRDYRFYASDLLHPSEQAEQYIFEKFEQTYFDETLKTFAVDWQKIQKALHHRPFQEYSKATQRFLDKLLLELRELPVDVSEEIETVEKRIKKIASHSNASF
ncbi:MAG: GSCFA domain-containing protein [Siphonobacter sp.]